MKNKALHIFLLAKSYRTRTSEWQGAGSVFQEIRPGTGFITGDFADEKLGGLPTAERSEITTQATRSNPFCRGGGRFTRGAALRGA